MSILAIDVGGTGIKYTLFEKEQIGEVNYFSTPKTWRELKEKIVSLALTNDNISGITLSVPGAVDSEKGIIYGFSALPYIHNFPLKDELEIATGKNIYLENDANCAGLAEAYYGAAKDFSSSVSFIIGSGIGGAVVINKKLLKGKNLFAGEFGFMITERGQTLSELASPVHASVRYSEKMNLETGISGKELFSLKEKGDKLATEEIEQIYRALAIGIYNVCLTVDPDIVLLGGGISVRLDILQPVLENLAHLQEKYHSQDQKIKVEICHFQKDANLIGAFANYQMQVEG